MGDPPDTPRTTLQLIFDPEFGRALLGKVIMVTSFWAQTMLFVVLAFELTHSAVWVGVVTGLQLLPQLLLALVSGTLADRRGPRLPIVAGGLFGGASCLGLAGALTLPNLADSDLVMLPVVLSAALGGVGIALASAPMQAVAPRLSTPGEFSTAVSLNFFPTALARAIGPLLGSLLAATMGSTASLVVVGVTCVASAVLFCTLRRLGPVSIQRGAGGSFRSVLSYVAKDKRLQVIFGSVAAIGAGSEAAITLAPALSVSLGSGAAGAGWVTGAFGVGGLVGIGAYNVYARFLRPIASGWVAFVCLGVCMVVIGLSVAIPVTVVALVVAGASVVHGITAFSVSTQLRSPAGYLGRVMALWMMAFAGVRALAGPVLGAISDHLSTAAAFILAGSTTLVAGLVCFILWRRGKDLDQADATA